MINYYTQQGFDKLKKELHELKTVKRKDISLQIAEARDKGDLSENAEYDAAKDAQGMLELKISQLESLVANARVIDESKLSNEKVSILSKVKLKNIKAKIEVTYTLVAEEEANLAEKKISIESPIGKGLMGKVVGDVVNIKVPAGELQLEVLDISF